jgi:hypothetical protein
MRWSIFPPPVGAINSNLFFREDSPVSEDSNDSDSSNDWMIEEKKIEEHLNQSKIR